MSTVATVLGVGSTPGREFVSVTFERGVIEPEAIGDNLFRVTVVATTGMVAM